MVAKRKLRKRKLTNKQRAFIDEYLVDLNGTQSAIRAGYSAATANRIATKLLSKVVIQEKIAVKQAARAKRTQIDSDYVLKRLAAVDQMDVIDILNDDGSVKVISSWPKIWRQFISGLDISETSSTFSVEGDGEAKALAVMLKKIKWPDKVKNLELIGKHVDVQAWREQQALTGHDGGAIETKWTVEIVGIKKE